jgi:N-methylhydantoinase A/oxoprolinase/acetone carboxylase beta subunit
VIAGVDTGGTFTDVVFDDGTIAKVPSRPDDPAAAVADGLGSSRPTVLAHGTTVATNALLERRGARVALVTNAGFEDVIEIARQDRPSLYDMHRDRPAPLVERPLRVGVRGRLDATGAEIEPLGHAPEVPADADVVAVCLLHSDLNAEHERALAGALSGREVVCSHEVSPEFREYERTCTTVISAYLRPLTRDYLSRLTSLADEVVVMTSAGGLVPLGDAADRPAALLLSGPAGGVRAGAAAAVAAGFADAVTFDMGGTSTDVCLVLDGVPAPAAEREVAGFPVRVPSLDVHTIGAGGGSIAYIDAGGALVVGPQSAGAVPGPACYGGGGREPTVTDADLVAGRIAGDAPFAALGKELDASAAVAALERAGVTADGVIRVVDAAMVQAIRAVTVERGVDPRELALVAFGGAGPLHACALAGELEMAAVIVPPRAGVLSAAGIMTAPRQTDLVRSWPTPSDHSDLEDALSELAPAAGDGDVVTSVDCRYAGQSHELTVASVADFPAEHARRNGYERAGAPVEVVALRATVRRPAPIDALPPPLARRESAVGPCTLSEPDCTVWLPAGWTATVHESGSWILRRSRS